METTTKRITCKNRRSFLLVFTLIFGLFAQKTYAAEIPLESISTASSTLTVYYDNSTSKLYAKYNTSTYNCGASVLSRKYTIYLDGSQITSSGVQLNGGNKNLNTTLLTNPKPETKYSVRLLLEQECFGAWTTAFDKTLNVSISALSDFKTSFSGTTLTATWVKGDIGVTKYTLTLKGKSKADPNASYQTIETQSITSGTSTTFKELYTGIDYKTEIIQYIPGGYTVSASFDLSVTLGSTFKPANIWATANTSNVEVTWSSFTNRRLITKVIVNRQLYNTNTTTVSESYIYKGVNNSTTSNTYIDDSEVSCKEHEYSLDFFFIREGEDFNQIVYSAKTTKILFPKPLTNAPSTARNFESKSLNTPSLCTKDIELKWDQDESRHPCQEYWFEIDRYLLDNNGNINVNSKTTILQKGNTALTFSSGKYTFIDKDAGKIEGATYKYELRTVTKWPTGQVYNSSVVSRTEEIGGTIDVSGSTVTATIDPSTYIKISWGDLSNEGNYIVRRKVGTEIDKEVTLGQNVTTYTDMVSGDAASCIDYVYEVLGKNSCEPNGKLIGSVSTGKNVLNNNTENLTLIADFKTSYNNKALLAHKGYERDFVFLEWTVAANSSSFINQKLYRKLITSDAAPILIATLDAGARTYTDLQVGANDLYIYYLEAEVKCGAVVSTTNRIEAIGFRTPWGIVNGHVDYVGGVDVEGALISAENPAAQALNKSTYFDGDRDFAISLGNNTNSTIQAIFQSAETNDLSFLYGNKARTIEFWARPEEFNGGSIFSIGEKTIGSLEYLSLNVPSSASSNVWNIDLGSEKLIVDLEGIVDLNEWHHFALSYDTTSIRFYVDGSNLDGVGSTMIWDRELNTLPNITNALLILGASYEVNSNTISDFYKGYLDEFRVWGKAKTEGEINFQKNGFLFGSEAALNIYLRMDENYGDFLYDASYYDGNKYNRRHFSIERTATGNNLSFSSTIPASDQLGYNAITDSRGNYSIPYVRYRGTGEIFNIVPFIFQHSFRPSNRNLFIGQSSPVHNEQNFEDISAFKVTGTVFYGREEDGDTVEYCPAAGLFMAIDGTIALKGGLPVTTNADGEFELSVPIGEHFISIGTTGHTFLTGRFPAEGTFDFQEEKSGIRFIDNTQTKVIGKVVGGTVEGNKVSGFGKTKNNVGQAKIVFDGGCFVDTAITDSETGEYTINVFPLEYVIKGGANPLDQEQFVASDPEVKFVARTEDLRLLRPILTEKDTVYTQEGEISKVTSLDYNVRYDFVHRVPHSLFVLDQTGKNPFNQGDEYIQIIPNDGIVDTILTSELDYPVFTQFNTYQVIIKLTEVYTNKDNSSKIIYDTVSVNDAQITIANEIGDENISLDFDASSADTLYEFVAGIPNILINEIEPEKGFLKRLEITSAIGSSSNTFTLEGYVLGNKPDGTSFVTVGPVIPQHILRDPPGTSSFATISKGRELTSTASWDIASNVGTSNDIIVSVGSKFSTGVGLAIDTEIEGSVKVVIDAEATLSGGGDYTETISISEDISTSDDPLFVGADADLFIGKAYNINFGVADYLKPIASDQCALDKICKDKMVTSKSGKSYQIGKTSNFTVNPNGYDTYFIYTQKHIKTQLIPDLLRLRNQILSTNPDYSSKLSPEDPNYGKNNDDPVFGNLASTDTPYQREQEDFDGPSYTFSKIFTDDEEQIDSVRGINEQIRIWEIGLTLNELQKVNAVNAQSLPDVGEIKSQVINEGLASSGAILRQETGELEKNISFSAGSSYSREVTLSRDIAWRFAWEINLSTTLAQKIEGKVNGTGAEINNSLTIGVTQSGETSAGQSHSTTYGFTLKDDDYGNFYSVDILDGGNQNGPIFKTRGGTSSCPYEGETVTDYYQPGTVISPATVQFDRPYISITPANQVGIPSDEEAVYTLSLGNENTTYDNFIIYSLYVEPSTNQNGALLYIDGQNVDRDYYLMPGSLINRQLVVKKSPQQNEYKDIQLVLQSQCDVNVYDDVFFSATFIPTCSKSSIITPLNQWVVNNSFNNILPITLGEYDINFSGLQKVVFRYKPSKSAQWIERVSFYNKETVGGDSLLLSRLASTTLYNWDISSLEDGSYDLQLISFCEDGTSRESAIVSGIIDRLNPHIFGKPSPADGVLSPNDEISIKFNEQIDAEKIIKNLNFDVRGVLNGTPILHFTSVGFDGNDKLEISNLSTQNAFTHEFWFNKETSGVEEELINHGTLTIGINAANHLYVKDGASMVEGKTAIATDKWSHAAISYDEATKQITIYVDGVTDISASFESGANNSGIVLGKSFTGKMHEYRIWTDSRLLTEIRLNYLKTLSGNEKNLAGYWPMDEGFGTVVKDKTGRRDAVMSATWHFAQEARGVAMDGVDDYFEIDGSTVAFGPEEDFTMSYWFKSNESANVTLFSTGNVDGPEFDYQAWVLRSDANGDLKLVSNGNEYVVAGNYLDGTWHHLALVVNRLGFVNLYMDGKVVLSTASSAFSSFAGNKISLGVYNRFEGIVQKLDGFMNGAIDEVRIWNTARTADQILRDMHYRLKGDELGLFAYFPFERYTRDSFGQYILTETLSDISDKTKSGLDAVESVLQGGATFTNLTPAMNIERPIQAVTFSYAINGDQIIITPTDDNAKIENVTLDITVDGLRDVNGNKMSSPITWIAYVDKNQVQWFEQGHSAVITSTQSYTFTTKIVNSGGETMAYNIDALPTWLSVNKASGSIAPLSEVELTFKVQEGLPIGRTQENVLLSTKFGYDEVFQVDMTVKAQAPAWQIDADKFEYSMNLIAQVSLDGEIVTNEETLIAAFVGSELRGVAPISNLGAGRDLVFMTIFSNTLTSESVSFRIWDSETGEIRVATASPSVVYENESIVGSLTEPVQISATEQMVYSYTLKSGWNWISAPFVFEDALPANVLKNLNSTSNDVLKGQEAYSQFETGYSWGGSLTSVDSEEAYKLYVKKAATFDIQGTPIAVSTPISIETGWNWIAYLPTSKQAINDALSGYVATDGDLIKSQSTFAVYDTPTDRWIGTLTTLAPTKGYMLHAASNGELIYSEKESSFALRTTETEDVEVNDFATNMSLIVSSNLAKDGYTCNAYKDGLLRGRTSAIDGKYYLTVSGEENEQIAISFENESSKYEVARTLTYQPDDIQYLTYNFEQIDANLSVYPLPFESQIVVQYAHLNEGNLNLGIYNVTGVLLETIYAGTVQAGSRVFEHNTELENGVYLLKSELNGEVTVTKIVK